MKRNKKLFRSINVLMVFMMLFVSLPSGMITASASPLDTEIDSNNIEMVDSIATDVSYYIYLPLIFRGNTPPVANNDAYTTAEDTILEVNPPGVLGNDVDNEAGPLQAELVSGTLKGTIDLSADGSFVYTPNLDFFGNDSFTYKVSDGKTLSNIATVTIEVTPVKDSPIAIDDEYSVEINHTLNIDLPGVLENDIDVDGNNMIASLVTNVANGVLVLLSDGSFTYTPDKDYFGNDTFTYQLITYPILDVKAGWTDDAVVTITVQDSIAAVVAGTTLTGDLDALVATFPLEIPEFFDSAGYKINSEIVLAGNVDGTITITRDGYPPFVITGGLDAGTYTFTQLVAIATGMVEPTTADFTDAIYGGQVENYSIVVSGNTTSIDTTVTVRSVISDDGFISKTVLAEITLDLVLYNGAVTGAITSDQVGVVSGTLDFEGNELVIVGQVTGIGNLTTFVGTVSGAITGDISAQINANGIDTLSGIITNTGATEPVRILGIFGQTGTAGDFEGEIITGPIPVYPTSMSITGSDTVVVGESIQLAVESDPQLGTEEVVWSVYVNHSDLATITIYGGLLSGSQAGTVTVIAKALDGSLLDATKSITVAGAVYNGAVTGAITSDEFGVVNGTLDFEGNELVIVGQVTGIGNLTTFVGTVSGAITGDISAQINANGIDTLSGIITNTGATEPVRILGIFGQTGVDGDFEGEIITGPIPVYPESMTITGPNTVAVGESIQLAVTSDPQLGTDEVAWSVYVNHSDLATITIYGGLLSGSQAGTVIVIAKALDGSLLDATKTITITE